jgi:drug/metabolite transporter (DMT)-like permease
MSTSTASKPLSAWISLIAICIIWGTTYLGIKVAVTYMPGLFLAGLRNLIAGFVLLIIAFFTAKEKPDFKTILFLIAIGFLNLGLGNGLVSWAEEYVSSGLTAILCAMTPLWITIFSLLILRDARLNWMSISGLILGLLGIVGVFRDYLIELINPNYQLGIGLIITANIAWGLGSVLLAKNKPKLNVFYISGIQIFSAGIILMSTSLGIENIPELSSIPINAWAWLAYLIVFGSILSYIAYMHALKHFMPTRVSIYAYVNPIVAIWLGWLVLDEILTWFMFFSSLITILGVWMVNRGYAKAKVAKFDIPLVSNPIEAGELKPKC